MTTNVLIYNIMPSVCVLDKKHKHNHKRGSKAMSNMNIFFHESVDHHYNTIYISPTKTLDNTVWCSRMIDEEHGHKLRTYRKYKTSLSASDYVKDVRRQTNIQCTWYIICMHSYIFQITLYIITQKYHFSG